MRVQEQYFEMPVDFKYAYDVRALWNIHEIESINSIVLPQDNLQHMFIQNRIEYVRIYLFLQLRARDAFSYSESLL